MDTLTYYRPVVRSDGSADLMVCDATEPNDPDALLHVATTWTTEDAVQLASAAWESYETAVIIDILGLEGWPCVTSAMEASRTLGQAGIPHVVRASDDPVLAAQLAVSGALGLIARHPARPSALQACAAHLPTWSESSEGHSSVLGVRVQRTPAANNSGS